MTDPKDPMTLTSETTSTDEAVAAVVALACADDEPTDLAVLTDEELYAYCDEPADSRPHGLWFANLSEEAQQAAALGALRSSAARDTVDVQVDTAAGSDEAVGRVELDDQVVAALALRSREVRLSLRVVGSMGETWYLLRHVEHDLWCREVVTTHGFHLVSLVRLDDAEREVYLTRLQLPQGGTGAEAPAVDVHLSEAELEAAAARGGDELDFLTRTRHIGNLVRFPGPDGETESLMVHVQPDGSLVVGDIGGGSVRYRGGVRADLVADWDAWVARSATDLDGGSTEDGTTEDAGDGGAGAPPSLS